MLWLMLAKHKQHKLLLGYCGITSYIIMGFLKFISDQGRNFESDLIQELCKIAGVKKLHTLLIIHKVMANVKDLIPLFVTCWALCLMKKNLIGNLTLVV